MRVAPPTSTTPLMSAGVTCASRSALRVGVSVRCTSGSTSDANVSCEIVCTRCAPPDSVTSSDASGRTTALLQHAHTVEQQAHIFGRERLRVDAGLREHVIEQRMVEIVAAERGIAARGQHFEHALRQLQDRQVERAAAEVIHRIEAFGPVVETVGDRRGGRFVQQAQHVEAREARGILGRLALRFVEIRGHRDHRANQVVAKRIFRAITQRRENLGRHFDRFHAVDGTDLHHARRIDEFVRRVRRASTSALPRPMKRLTRSCCADRWRPALSPRGRCVGRPSRIADHRRQQHAARFVRQDFRHAVAHGRDERIRRAEIDPDGESPLMRRRRHARFGNCGKAILVRSGARPACCACRKARG